MIASVSKLVAQMKSHGASRFYAKRLSPNDNSKNQVYLGGDFSALNIIPHHAIEKDEAPVADAKRERLKAKVTFSWIDDGGIFPAPAAQLILYPRYPEVRFSGFLLGSRGAPSKVMATRDPGRVIVLGICPSGQIFGYAAAPDDPLAREIVRRAELRQIGVFVEIPDEPGASDTRTKILSALKDIHQKGWIESQRLIAGGTRIPYTAPNGGGFTLEAELGIIPNGRSEPDYHGWEVKQFGVTDFVRFRAKSPITLMTPEPTGGTYGDVGITKFMDLYAYPDKKGRAHRMNFGGVYACDRDFHPTTGLRLRLVGYSATRKTDIDIQKGGIALLAKNDELAAFWPFIGLMEHWNRKHNQAAYVPSMFRSLQPAYRYGAKIQLCELTDFFMFLNAIEAGVIYYDPAIKAVGSVVLKRRSQFRIREPNIPSLYGKHEFLDLKPIS
jgi:hypothetical protein